MFTKQGYLENYIAERNKIMSRQIQKAFLSGNCTKAIFLVGELHAKDNIDGFVLKSVQATLIELGFFIQTYDVTPDAISLKP